METALFSPVTSTELTEYPGSDLRCIALLYKLRINKAANPFLIAPRTRLLTAFFSRMIFPLIHDVLLILLVISQNYSF